jgi:hypothetical protein
MVERETKKTKIHANCGLLVSVYMLRPFASARMGILQMPWGAHDASMRAGHVTESSSWHAQGIGHSAAARHGLEGASDGDPRKLSLSRSRHADSQSSMQRDAYKQGRHAILDEIGENAMQLIGASEPVTGASAQRLGQRRRAACKRRLCRLLLQVARRSLISTSTRP